MILDRPLEALLDAPGVTEVSPQVEAFVARVATLALTVGAASSSAAVTRALAAGTPEALLGAFAELLVAQGPSATGAEVALRGRVALAEVIRQSGGLWRADEAQARLGVSRATLQTWRDGKRVLALPLSDGSYGYPVAQFAPPATDLERPRPLPGVADVLAAAGDRLAVEELAAILATPQPALAVEGGGPRSGFEALAAGDVDLVVGLVGHVVTPSDAGAPPATPPRVAPSAQPDDTQAPSEPAPGSPGSAGDQPAARGASAERGERLAGQGGEATPVGGASEDRAGTGAGAAPTKRSRGPEADGE